jgi:hypothetical protein
MKPAKQTMIIRLSLMATVLTFALACNQQGELFDPNTDTDWGIVNPMTKSDGIMRKSINVSGGDEETVRFRAPRLISLTMNQPESHWDDQPELDMHVTTGGQNFASGRSITPKMTLAVGPSDDGDALVEYVLTIRNHGSDSVWGELVIDGRPNLGPCEGTEGKAPNDTIQYVARCTQLDQGLLDGQSATYRVHDVQTCLSRGVSANQRRSYWNLQGHLESKTTDFDDPHSTQLFIAVYEDESGSNRVEITDESVTILEHKKGDVFDDDGDHKSQVTYDRKKHTLDFVRESGSSSSFSQWETQFATRWKCKAL